MVEPGPSGSVGGGAPPDPPMAEPIPLGVEVSPDAGAPPAPEPAPKAMAGGPRLPPTYSVEYPDGSTLSYFAAGYFCATCKHHTDCVKTRTSRYKKRDRKTRRYYGGRPLGFLAAWLAVGSDPGIGDQKAHCGRECMQSLEHGERQWYRRALEAMPGAVDLLSEEREKQDELGEESEPETLDGLLG